MNIKVFAIGGNWKFRNLTATGDCYIGTATDTATALSLLDLVEKNGGYAVSLHGDIYPRPISGEFTLSEAKKLFDKVFNNVPDKVCTL